jgi:carboxylesterase type B
MQLLANKSWGLYQRAGLESGAFFNWAFQPMDKAEKFYDILIKRAHWSNSSGTFNCSKAADLTGAARVACLREIPTGDLMRQSARNYQDAWDASAWAPVPDGVEFPMNSTPMELLASGAVAPVPVILGSNSDEGTGFMANDSSMSYPLALNTSGKEWVDWLGSAFISRGIFNSSDVPQVKSLYPRWNGSSLTGAMLRPNKTSPIWHYWGQPWLAAAAALTDYMFTCPNKRAAASLASLPPVDDSTSEAAGSSSRPPVFLYYFSHQPTDFGMRFGSVFSAAKDPNGIPSYVRGACHGCELSWVWYSQGRFHTKEEFRLADIMAQYWINFAATGDPNRRADGQTGRSLGLPLWETFGAAAHGTMQFGSNQTFIQKTPHTKPPNVTLDVRTIAGMHTEVCDRFWDQHLGPDMNR